MKTLLSLWMKGGGHAVTVTNPCPPHPARSRGSPCFWGCWAAATTSWGQAASPRCPELPRCCASSRSAQWVSPHAPRTRRGLSLDLGTTQVHQWQWEWLLWSKGQHYCQKTAWFYHALTAVSPFCSKRQNRNTIFMGNLNDWTPSFSSQGFFSVYIDWCCLCEQKWFSKQIWCVQKPYGEMICCSSIYLIFHPFI